MDFKNTLTLDRAIFTRRHRNSQMINKNEIDGCVLAVEDFFVECEIYLKNSQLQLRLPKVYFPNDVHFGMPIKLSLDETSGSRCPVIKKRPFFATDSKEIEALVNEL